MDLVLSSDNQYLIEAIDDDMYPITYQKNKTKEQLLNPNNFANVDVQSFNSPIGFITNLASNFIAMSYNYDENSKEYKELMKRVNLLRFFQGSAIDHTKGDIYFPPPKNWSKKQKYISLDGLVEEELKQAEEDNKKIAFNNRICGDKKAYFFGYVYPKLMKEYKDHKKAYESLCRQNFKMSLRDLEFKDDKTQEEKRFISRYIKYSPLMNNSCIMNILARYIEEIEFDNRWKSKSQYFDYNILLSGKYEINDKKLIHSIKEMISSFNYFQKMNITNHNYVIDIMDSEDEFVSSAFGNILENCELDLLKLCADRTKLTDYVVYVMYNYYKNKSKSLMWNIFGDTILNNVKSKSSKLCYPIRDDSGVEYLGLHYSLKEVNNEI